MAKTYSQVEREFATLDKKIFRRLEEEHFVDKLRTGYFNLDNVEELIATVTYLERAQMLMPPMLRNLDEDRPEHKALIEHINRFATTVNRIRVDAAGVYTKLCAKPGRDEDEDEDRDDEDDWDDEDDEDGEDEDDGSCAKCSHNKPADENAGRVGERPDEAPAAQAKRETDVEKIDALIGEFASKVAKAFCDAIFGPDETK